MQLGALRENPDLWKRAVRTPRLQAGSTLELGRQTAIFFASAFCARFSEIPLPGKTMTARGDISSISSLRRNGAARPWAVALASTMTSGSSARAYDMDCKVILCLAAGFPGGCGDAHSYMVRRLRKGKGPFGTCSGGSTDGGTYDVPVRRFIRKIRPGCTAWVSDRDGRYCSAWTPGRQEGVIGISIPQDEGLPDYSNEFIWWSRAWDPSDDEK